MANVTSEALAATILPDAPSAYEVTLNRQKLEGEQGKVAAVKAQTEQKAKEANAYKPKEIDFSQGYQGHDKIIAELNNEYIQGLQDLELQAQMHPGDSNYDYRQTGKLANLQLMKLEEQTKRRIGNSTQVKAAAENFYKALQGNDPSFTPEYVDAMNGWLGSRESIYDGAPQPLPEQFWDQEKWANLVKTRINEDKVAWANANGGYIDEGTTERITKDKVKQSAMSLAPTARPYQEFAAVYEEMPEAEKAKVNVAARQEGMNAVQYLAYKTLEPIAYTKTTKNISPDATFNNKMGSGWGKASDSMKRLAREIVSAGDLTSPHWKPWAGWLSGSAPQGYKGSTPRAVNMGFNGLSVGKDANGKEMFVTSTISNADGTISIIASNDVTDDKVGRELMRMDAKDFANNIVNTIAENNADIKREDLETELVNMGAVTGEGFVKTNQPKAKTAQQIAEERRKASGKNTKAMD